MTLRDDIADAALSHFRTPTSGCHCGGVPLGASYTKHLADALLAGPLADLATLPDRVRALADEWDTEHADWCCQRGCPNWQGTHPGEVEFTTDGGIRQIGPDFPCPGDCTCYVGPFRDRLRALTPDPRQEPQP